MTFPLAENFRRTRAVLLEGCSEAVMGAHGFTIEQMVVLVRTGLATVTPHRMKAGRERMEVARLRITDAGRQVLALAKS